MEKFQVRKTHGNSSKKLAPIHTLTTSCFEARRAGMASELVKTPPERQEFEMHAALAETGSYVV